MYCVRRHRRRRRRRPSCISEWVCVWVFLAVASGSAVTLRVASQSSVRQHASTFRKEYKHKMRLLDIVIIMDGKGARWYSRGESISRKKKIISSSIIIEERFLCCYFLFIESTRIILRCYCALYLFVCVCTIWNVPVRCARSTLVQCHRKKKTENSITWCLAALFQEQKKKQVVECIVKNLLFDWLVTIVVWIAEKIVDIFPRQRSIFFFLFNVFISRLVVE